MKLIGIYDGNQWMNDEWDGFDQVQPWHTDRYKIRMILPFKGTVWDLTGLQLEKLIEIQILVFLDDWGIVALTFPPSVKVDSNPMINLTF